MKDKDIQETYYMAFSKEDGVFTFRLQFGEYMPTDLEIDVACAGVHKIFMKASRVHHGNEILKNIKTLNKN